MHEVMREGKKSVPIVLIFEHVNRMNDIVADNLARSLCLGGDF